MDCIISIFLIYKIFDHNRILNVGNRRITIHDIANELDVTASTVSRALKDHPRISDSTKESVIRVAKKLNYQPNNVAASLRKGHTKTIGIIVPTADRNFFSSLMRGVEEVANNAGYNVIMSQSYDAYKKEQTNIRALLEARVDGILASIAMETKEYSHYQEVISQGVPLIFYDRAHASLNTSSVEVDDYQGAYNAVQHLIEQGCKRIAHFSGPQHIKIYQERLRGYKDALKDHKFPIVDDLIQKNSIKLDSGRRATENILARDLLPDAIFSASDYAAMGAIQELKKQSLQIPGDIAVVGFSNEPFTSLVEPSLTTVDQHTHNMGKSAAKLFLYQVQQEQSEIIPRKMVLQPELIIRESSSKA